MAEIATYLDIYNTLLAGKKLRMKFSSAEEAKKFRNTLSSHKSKQDKVLLAIGEDRDSMHFEWTHTSDDGVMEFLISFHQERVKRLFTYEIVEEDAADCYSSEEESGS